MSLDKTSGAGYSFGKRIPAADASVFALQGLDGKVGTNISCDADTTLTIANGVTYRITGAATGSHALTIPITGLGGVERVSLRFDCNMNSFTYTVKEKTSGNTICTVTGAGAIKQGFVLYWDGTNWRNLVWSPTTGGTATIDQ